MYQELMLDFLKKKDQIIFNETNIHLYDTEDYKDVKDWNEEFCEEFFKKVEAQPYDFLSDSIICPWCLYKEKYRKCSYGERHGACYGACLSKYNKDNPYARIIDILTIKMDMSMSIVEIPKIEDLILYILKDIKQLKEREIPYIGY
jgi:hypothetical protein